MHKWNNGTARQKLVHEGEYFCQKKYHSNYCLMSDCIYFILYSGDWKNDEVWDPNFGGLADDEITIRNLGVDWVRKEWMTEEFMGFVFKYAGPVSQTSKVLLERIQDYPDNIMYLAVSKIDVAWALLVYVNNIDVQNQILKFHLLNSVYQLMNYQ